MQQDELLKRTIRRTQLRVGFQLILSRMPHGKLEEIFSFAMGLANPGMMSPEKAWGVMEVSLTDTSLSEEERAIYHTFYLLYKEMDI